MKRPERRLEIGIACAVTLPFFLASVGCGDNSLEAIRADVNSVRRAVDRIEESQESIQKEIARREDSSPQLAEELQEIRKELQERRMVLVAEIQRLQEVVAVRDAALQEIREAERIRQQEEAERVRQEEKVKAQVLDWELIKVPIGTRAWTCSAGEAEGRYNDIPMWNITATDIPAKNKGAIPYGILVTLRLRDDIPVESKLKNLEQVLFKSIDIRLTGSPYPTQRAYIYQRGTWHSTHGAVSVKIKENTIQFGLLSTERFDTHGEKLTVKSDGLSFDKVINFR